LKCLDADGMITLRYLENRMTGNELDSFVSGEKHVAAFVNRAMNRVL